MDDTDTAPRNRYGDVTWTSERIERLRQLHAEGKSALVIAEILTRELRLNITRNMICGKKQRMGLTGGARPGARPDRPRLVKETKAARARREPAPVPQKSLPPLPTPQSDWDIPVGQRRTLWELTANTCRFPVGEGAEMFFCGAEPEPKYPYCHAHCRRAYSFMPRAA